MSPSPRLATREEQRITQLELERDSLRDQLTRLQQDVKPLVALCVQNHSLSTEVQTFLTAHPECKP